MHEEEDTFWHVLSNSFAVFRTTMINLWPYSSMQDVQNLLSSFKEAFSFHCRIETGSGVLLVWQPSYMVKSFGLWVAITNWTQRDLSQVTGEQRKSYETICKCSIVLRQSKLYLLWLEPEALGLYFSLQSPNRNVQNLSVSPHFSLSSVLKNLSLGAIDLLVSLITSVYHTLCIDLAVSHAVALIVAAQGSLKVIYMTSVFLFIFV